MRIQTSLYGMPRPIVYGRTRIAPNLIWYDDFFWKPVQNSKKGSSGGGTGKKGGGEYDYGAAVILGLCQGPIVRIGTVWNSQGNLPIQETTETYTVPGGGGSYTATQQATYLQDEGVTRGDAYSVVANDYGSPGPITLTGVQQTPMAYGSVTAGHYTRGGINNATYHFSAADGGKTMTISYSFSPPFTSGGVPQDPITSIAFTLFAGAQGQAVWSYLATKHPSQAIGYSTMAYLATPLLDLGMSGTLPSFNFEIYGLLPWNGGVGDCDPSDVLYDMLTNPIYGCGLQVSEIGSMAQFSNYCVANGLFISPAMTTERTASDWIKDFLDATNSEIVESGGVLNFVPRGDTTLIANGVTFTPTTNPIYSLTADDFIRSGTTPPIEVSRPSIQDAYNSVRIQYFDRGNSYNPSYVEAQDLSAINLYKYRPEPTRQYDFFTTQAAASQCSAVSLARLVYVRNQYKFKLPQSFILLDPMDIITVPAQLLGIAASAPAVPVRILTIDEQADRTLDVTAEQFPWGTSGPTLYDKQSMEPGGPDANAPPGSINTPIIFEALSRLNNQIGHNIWFGLSGASANWGGCQIWVSMDGTNYKQVATAIGQCQMGVLTANLASHADPDTVDTLSVDLTESLGALSSYTSAETDVFASLCYVDGELISYETATLTGTYKYDLGTLLRRGVYGSAIGAHAIGTNFLFLNDSVEGWNYDVGLIGTTVYFKFTSFNQSGLVQEALADATAYPYTITGACIGLLTPAHATYRPTTNPLTATDAGSSATINIASFAMRIPGQADIPFGSGAITGLSYRTLYYIFFADPGFVPLSSPTYLASTTQEVALNSAGYMFVGSIITPQSGGADTAGNNDGGGGAQVGMIRRYSMILASVGSATGNGATANPGNAVDGDQTSYASLTVNGNGALNIAPALSLTGPPAIVGRFSHVKIKVLASVPTNSLNNPGDASAFGSAGFDVAPPYHGTAIFAVGGGSTLPLAVYEFDYAAGVLPPSVNLGKIGIGVQAQCGTATGSGSMEVRIYDAWIEVTE
jgi:hypothetical protein